MNRQRITSGLLALVVLVSGLGLAVAPGAAATYDDGDEALVVQVDWDDVEVNDGDTTQLDVDGETVDVVVRHSESTDDATHWVAFDDLDLDPADGDEMTVAVATDAEGTVTADQSVGYVGAHDLEISDGEMVEAELLVDEDYTELPVDVDLAVYDDGDRLNSSTLTDLNGSDWDYHDFEPQLGDDTNSTTVTVQVDHVEDDLGEQAFESVEEFDVQIVSTGILGIGGGDSDLIIIGAIVVVAGFVLLRD